MEIKHTVNGKQTKLNEVETEISFDLGEGKDLSTETTYYVNQGQAMIISHHVNPNLKN